MAQPNTNNQLTDSDFAEVRPWTAWGFPNLDDAPNYRQTRYREPIRSTPGWSDLFNRAIYRQDPNTGEMRPEFCLARLVSEAADHVKYLQRMADSRNVVLAQPPRKDGQNFQRLSQFEMTWHMALTLQNLFHRGLYNVLRPFNFLTRYSWYQHLDRNMFLQCFTHLRSVDRLEQSQTRRLSLGYGTLPNAFKWLLPFERSITDAYETLAAAWTWSEKESAGQRDFAQALEFAIQDIPEMTRLLVILLEREKSFEDLFSREHVFGCLFDKRIMLISPRDLSILWQLKIRNSLTDRIEHYLDVYQHLEGMYRELSIYQQRLKELFDFKYLIDWHWNKMWDQLYVVINPNMHISDQTVDKFVNWSTNNGELARNVFGVHPIKREQLADQTCAVCLDNFLESDHPVGVMVLKTICGHYFHPQCIIESWDVGSFWQNRCPYCRQSAGKLRDITPFFDPGFEDREHEEPGIQFMDQTYYDTVEEHILTRRRILAFDQEVQDAYWIRKIREEVLDPQRAQREANRPTWESILGGG